MMMIGGRRRFKMPIDNDWKWEGLNMCFIFMFWLPEYRTEIVFWEETQPYIARLKNNVCI